MSKPVALSQIPRPKTPEKYDRRRQEESFQALERDIGQKHDKRSDLVLTPGKRLVLSDAGLNTQYAIGISGGLLTLTDYVTGAAGTFLIDWESVDGLSEQLLLLEAGYEAADDVVTSAFISADAVVASDAASARATLSTTLTAAYEAADSSVASGAVTYTDSVVATEAGVRASADSALEAAYQAADSSLTTAYIAADSVVASSADSANAALSTTLTAAYQAADASVSGAANTYTDSAVAGEAGARASADSTLLAGYQSGDTAAIASANTFTITEVAAEAAVRSSQISTVTAQSTSANRNLMPYPSGGGNYEQASELGWSQSVSNGSGLYQGYWSPYGGNLYEEYWVSGYSNANTIYYIFSIPVTWGGYYTISATGQAYALEGVFVHIKSRENGVDTAYSPSHVLNGSRFSETVNAPSGSDELQIVIGIPAQTKSGYCNFNIWQIKVEAGSIATAFSEEESVSVLKSETSILQDAFVDPTTGKAIARLALEASASGGTPARFSLYSDSEGTANVALEAPFIYFGDNTVFEDTYNSFYTEDSGVRNRFGGPFPASGDILHWFGPDSVALDSETKTNGHWAMATDGKVYYGSAELGGSGGPLTISFTGTMSDTVTGPSSSTVTLAGVTAVPAGGSGTYTHSWQFLTESGSVASFGFTSGTSVAAVSGQLTGCPSYFEHNFSLIYTVTDTVSGESLQRTLAYTFISESGA